jgi:hypothetical protein
MAYQLTIQQRAGYLHIRVTGENGPETVRRIAYVDVNNEHSQSDMHFAETLAVNLGVNIKIFPTVSEAEEWLRDAAATTDT